MLGDAVHPMLPYMASGAAMACEDAAVLRQVLRVARKDTIKEALAKYQEIRQPRVSYLQRAGRRLQYEYHHEDGPLQQERDQWIAKDDVNNPIFWGHEERRNWLFGYDAEKDAINKLGLSGNQDAELFPTASTDFYCAHVPDYHKQKL